MDKNEVREIFDRVMRENARPDGPGALVERVGGVVRQSGSADHWNGVVWSDLTQDTADAAIAEQVRHFGLMGREFEWKLYAHDLPVDLPERLKAAGFVPEPTEALMVAEVREQLAHTVELPERVRLVPVTDAAGVDLVARAHTLAFGREMGGSKNRLVAQLAETPDQVIVVVAMAGDEPVSGARMELHPGTGFAGLWGGGTAPGWRGRGIYRALVAHRAAIAAERGYRYLQVDASDQSRPILERLGFSVLSTTTPYVRGAGA
ncbi:GNAT family N-acetyltransferase [Streptacidiphilus sp. N1-3]|uniref:GNAT family N-acetyltransferase n=1 Tax=Streptacidiphilus alkalitolerans TaxID=3342712 RepID=A0ABV6WWW2_9ACTN